MGWKRFWVVEGGRGWARVGGGGGGEAGVGALFDNSHIE